MKKHILSCTCEREIDEPMLFDTQQEAHAEMTRQYKEALGIEGTYLDRLQKAAEEKGWSMIVEDDEAEFRQASPAGEDFGFSVSADNIVEEVKVFYYNFLPEHHANELFNAGQHGLSGVPDLRVLLDDAEEIREMLEFLWDALADVEGDEGNGEICADSAYCENRNHDNVDWKIHEVDIPTEKNTMALDQTKHHVFGDYVLTPVPNAFNKNTSWWLSKRGFTISIYCFSTNGTNVRQQDEAVYHIQHIDAYIKSLEARLDFINNAVQTEEGASK